MASSELRKMGMDTFIPRYNIEKIGLIKGIPTDVPKSSTNLAPLVKYSRFIDLTLQSEESNKVE